MLSWFLGGVYSARFYAEARLTDYFQVFSSPPGEMELFRRGVLSPYRASRDVLLRLTYPFRRFISKGLPISKDYVMGEMLRGR